MWNVTLDENKHAIMTQCPIDYYLDESLLYIDPWILDLERSIREEDQWMEEMDGEWDYDTDEE